MGLLCLLDLLDLLDLGCLLHLVVQQVQLCLVLLVGLDFQVTLVDLQFQLDLVDLGNQSVLMVQLVLQLLLCL